MISLEDVVWAVLYLLGAGLIFGLLFWLISYCEKEASPSATVFFKFARIFLVVAAVFVLIGMILAFMGHPLIAWRR